MHQIANICNNCIPMIWFNIQNNDLSPHVAIWGTFGWLWGIKKAHRRPLNWLNLLKQAYCGNFWHFQLLFDYLFLIKIKETKGWLVLKNKKGCILPLCWCARNKNSTLFLRQKRWLLFFTFSGTPCSVLW